MRRLWVALAALLFVSPLAADGFSSASPAGQNLDVTAFGELSVAEPEPVVQLQFPYGVNPRLVTSITAGSGASTVTNSLLSVSTGATTASDALFRSVLNAKYEPGQGMLARFTAVFQASGTAGTEAVIGYGNEEDGFFFGYNGTSFGILHRFGGATEYQTLTITRGAVTALGTITITLDGTATEVEVANNDSNASVARAIGAVTFAGWETEVIGPMVVFVSHLAEVKAGAFTFADTDTTGVTASFVETITGVAPTDDWKPQANWTKDTFPSLNHDKGNVYQIRFQWLGFGAVSFYIETPDTGTLTLVHRIEYANANTSPSLQNPTLPLYVAVKNGATTTDIIVKTSSMAAFTEGMVTVQGLNNAAVGTAEGDLTTETSILAIKNLPTFGGKANRVEFQPLLLTFSAAGSAGSKFTTLRMWFDPILGGPAFFSSNATSSSTVAFDTTGTTVTGGTNVASFEFGDDVENFTLILTDFVVRQPPGRLIVFTVQIPSGTTDVDVGLIWRELF